MRHAGGGLVPVSWAASAGAFAAFSGWSSEPASLAGLALAAVVMSAAFGPPRKIEILAPAVRTLAFASFVGLLPGFLHDRDLSSVVLPLPQIAVLTDEATRIVANTLEALSEPAPPVLAPAPGSAPEGPWKPPSV